MAVAACVESKRVHVATAAGAAPMAIWWLLPQYVLCGLVDMFTVVGLQELFYEEMPVAMRSVGAAAYISVIGVGNLLSGGLISVVQEVSSRAGVEWLGDDINRANLQYFYWLLAAMSALNLCCYIFLATRFVYKKMGHDDDSHHRSSGKESS